MKDEKIVPEVCLWKRYLLSHHTSKRLHSYLQAWKKVKRVKSFLFNKRDDSFRVVF